MGGLSESDGLSLIERFDTSFGYLDDLCSLDNSLFHTYIKNVYPKALLQSNGGGGEAAFLNLGAQINNLHCAVGIYDKSDDFDFDIVGFPHLDGDIPRGPSCGACLSQLIRFARLCGGVGDFNEGNSIMSRRLLKQGFLYHGLGKAFGEFCDRHFGLVGPFGSSLVNLIEGGIHISMGISSKRLKGWNTGPMEWPCRMPFH